MVNSVMANNSAENGLAGLSAYQMPNGRNNGGEIQVGDQGRSALPKLGSTKAVMASEYYSYDKLLINYTNGDGDKVSLSMEHIEYQKAIMAAQESGDPKEMKMLIDKIKEEFLNMKMQLIEKVIEGIGGDEKEKEKVEKTIDESGIPGLPEYWNAENTSQRIVDFATSFYSLFEGSGEEYLSLIKGAVEEGFSQAREMMGELPEAVDNLVNNTYDLVMQKLDAWADEQGVGIKTEEEMPV